MRSRLIALLLACSTCMAFVDSDPPWQTPPPIASDVLGEARSYRVMLPETYDGTPDQAYPLLLVLDGQRYGDLIAAHATFMAANGEIPDHIIVALDSGNRLRDFTPTDSPDWEGDGGASTFLAFLEKELLPKIEEDYRVSRPHIIWGHSAGGLFALYTQYAAPHLFDARLVNDGSLDWDDGVSARLLKPFLEQDLATSQFLYFNSSYLRPLEDSSGTYFDSLSDLLRAEASEHLRWVYEPMPDERHASIPMLGSIHGLRHLYEGYQVPEPVMLAGLDAVLQHYERIRGRVGAPSQVPEAVLNDFGYLMMFEARADAVRAFELATQLYPQSANAWDSLSDGYLESGRFDDALAATEQSIALARTQGSSNLDAFVEKHAEILQRKHAAAPPN